MIETIYLYKILILGLDCLALHYPCMYLFADSGPSNKGSQSSNTRHPHHTLYTFCHIRWSQIVRPGGHVGVRYNLLPQPPNCAGFDFLIYWSSYRGYTSHSKFYKFSRQVSAEECMSANNFVGRFMEILSSNEVLGVGSTSKSIIERGA